MSDSNKNLDIVTTFLSDNNLKQNYEQVVRTVKNNASINLDRYPGMSRQFQKMAQIGWVSLDVERPTPVPGHGRPSQD